MKPPEISFINSGRRGEYLHLKETAENIGTGWFESEMELIKNHKPDIKDILEQKVPEKRCYLEMDGAMLRELGGFHDNKLDVMFSESDMIQNGDGENALSTILKKTLVSSFNLGADDFELRLKHWLIKSRTCFASEIVTISDGAICIENIVNRLLPGGTPILDWFHAKAKLWVGKIQEVLDCLLKDTQKLRIKPPCAIYTLTAITERL